MKRNRSATCLLLFLCPGLLAQSKTTRVRGTVEDASTRRPIGGATVSAAGDTAQQGEITDDNGFFRLMIEGVAPGDLVRIHVAKSGYIPYDRQIVTSEEIPITVDMRRAGAAGTAGPVAPKSESSHQPVVATDPLTARAIQMMTTEPTPFGRLNDLNIIVKSAAQNPAALSAVIAAIADADYRVREQAVVDLGWLNKPTPEVIKALQIALGDAERRVRVASISSLGKFRDNKDALAILFKVMGAPPRVDPAAAITLYRARVDDPRVMPALVYSATVLNDADCAAALKQMSQSKGTQEALFTALGTPPNINVGSMWVLQSLAPDDPRLIAALLYEASVQKNNDAIKALGNYPQNKDVTEALLTILGPANAVNEAAYTILINQGTDDPRLLKVLLSRANRYNAPAVTLLMNKAPLSAWLIERLTIDITASLAKPANSHTQIYIDILLKAGGAPGREALHRLLKTSDTKHQALLVLAWLEVDHSAPKDLLADLQLPETQDYLEQMTRAMEKGWVALPAYDSSGSDCNEGPSLRAMMGLSLLDLPPHKSPVKTLIEKVNLPDSNCAAYAAAAVGWLGPEISRAASGDLIKAVACHGDFPSQVGLDQKAAADTLSLIGDEHTISQMRVYQHPDHSFTLQDVSHCTNLGAFDGIIASIRARESRR